MCAATPLIVCDRAAVLSCCRRIFVQGQAFSVADAVANFPYYVVPGTLSVFIPVEAVLTRLFVGPYTLEYLESAFECQAELPVRCCTRWCRHGGALPAPAYAGV